MKPTKTITISLPVEMSKQIEYVAKEEHRTISELMREAFRQYTAGTRPQKPKAGKRKKMKLSWAGGLKEYRDKYTSLELQKKSLEWWGS